MKDIYIPIQERYAITISEAASYFMIGENRLRSIISEDTSAKYSFVVGNRTYIKRKMFEEYMDKQSVV